MCDLSKLGEVVFDQEKSVEQYHLRDLLMSSFPNPQVRQRPSGVEKCVMFHAHELNCFVTHHEVFLLELIFESIAQFEQNSR